MNLPLKVEKIIGKPTSVNASSVYSKRVPVLDGRLGTLVSLFTITGVETDDISAALSDIFDLTCKRIEEANESMLSALNLAVDSCRQYSDNFGVKLHYAHLFFFEDVCFIAKSNDFKVKLFSKEAPVEITFESGSGPVVGGQTYVVGSLDFFNKFELPNLENEKIEDIIDGFATEISTQDEQSSICAAFIEVGLIKNEDIVGETKEEAPNEKKESISESDNTPKKEESEIEAVNSDVSSKAEVPTDQAEIPTDEEFTYQIAANEPIKQKQSLVSKIIGAIFSFLKSVFREINFLKRGNISAIFRLRRNLAVLGILIFLILGISGSFALISKNNKQKSAEFNSHLESANSKFAEGMSLVDLNKSRAREILTEAQKEINLALEIEPGNDKAKKLSEEINNKLSQSENLTNINFDVFFNGSTSVNSLGLSSDLVIFEDKKITKMNLLNKNVIEELESEENIRLGTVLDKSYFIFTGSKVKKLDSANEVEVGQINNVLDIGVFFGNVYALTMDQIAKFVPVENGYVRSNDYLTNSEKFSDSSKIAIDGSVWVTVNNAIFQYLRGQKQNFEISGLSSKTGEFSVIFTSANSDNLYVIDRANSALLVIGKDGAYEKAFQSSEFAKTSDLVVDETGGKMYLAVGSKVLVADIK